MEEDIKKIKKELAELKSMVSKLLEPKDIKLNVDKLVTSIQKN